MSASPDARSGATALQLLLTAERLFAQHGIDGVALRAIAIEAGSANKSAIQYHFGSKDGLLRSIFAYRLADLVQRRNLLRARVDPDDLRSRFEAHIVPLLELAESGQSHYVSFVEQLERSGAAEVFAKQQDVQQSRNEFVGDMSRLLKHVPLPARTMRIEQVQALSLHTAAERERAVNRRGPLVPFGLYVSAVVDGFTGFLAAPVSEETRQQAARSKRSAAVPGVRLV
ncbi:MAG: TetR/AcrR family transcriptional regulator [Actinobacteria bacterium]|nr:TetR/AcrR family transcriptional regulator [Actinomycetota bacterium]